MSDPLQTLWAEQKEEPFAMSIADIHVRSARFQSRVRNRNWRELIVAAFMVVTFGWIGWIAPDVIVRIGAGLIIAGLIYVSVALNTKARAGSAGDLAAANTWADFYRDELERQYVALRDVWRWYLAPLVPGLVVFLVGASLTPANPTPFFAKAIVLAFSLAFAAAVFAGVFWINQIGARQLKAEIDKLDAARRG